MALVKVKPTSPAVVPLFRSSTRICTRASRLLLWSSPSRRTPAATITVTSHVRHQGGGHKQPIVWSISSATRTAFRPRLSVWSMIRTVPQTSLCFAMPMASAATSLPTKGMVVGQPVMSGSEAPIKSGNALPIRNIPVGTTICCVEMMPGKGAQLARSAGTSAQLLAREGSMLRFVCAPAKFVACTSSAVPPSVKSATKRTSLRKIGKAGANRWRGIRPTVRGVAMNPVITRTVVAKVVRRRSRSG
jgi:large subunit ribosomal protein L2